MKITPTIIKHVKICGNDHTYCGHPLFGEMMYFGGGEIAFMHQHAEGVDYAPDANLQHGQLGIHGKAKIMLTRSYDGGHTWPESERVVVYDGDQPLEARRAMFERSPNAPKLGANGVAAPELGPDTWLHFGQSYCGREIGEGMYALRCYMTRSDDRGKTWSKEIVEPLNYHFTLLQGSDTMIQRPGKLIKPFTVGRDENCDENTPTGSWCAVYCSEDNGATWEYVSEIARDPKNEIAFAYPHIVDLGGNRLAATTGAWFTPCAPRTRWIYISYSDDLGLNWTQPRMIKAFGISPYPLLLRDGRLLVVYAKRDVPIAARGLYGIVSNDEGKTWSEEFPLRIGDASCWDIGYPEAVELDDGTIFMGYYYCVNDGLAKGGARHIAGTLFRI